MFIQTVRQSAAAPARPTDATRDRAGFIFSTTMLGAALSAIALIAAPHSASAHGIAGKRFFPATLATEDPFVADEASVPTVSQRKTPGEDGEPDSVETEISVDISKRILPYLSVSIGDSYKRTKPREAKAHTGFGNLETGAKLQLYKSDEHEFIFSTGLDAEWGGTGAVNVDADRFTTYTPSILFGKGLGDLPDSMDLLKPLAITGTIGYAIPARAKSFKVNDDGDLITQRHAHMLNIGIAIEYSIPYLQSAVRDVGLGAPFNRLIPLVEITTSSPINRVRETTKITVNPGVLWAGQSFQLGVEAIIPTNDATGKNIGILGQLHFYLDDLVPSVFGKPLFE